MEQKICTTGIFCNEADLKSSQLFHRNSDSFSSLGPPPAQLRVEKKKQQLCFPKFCSNIFSPDQLLGAKNKMIVNESGLYKFFIYELWTFCTQDCFVAINYWHKKIAEIMNLFIYLSATNIKAINQGVTAHLILSAKPVHVEQYYFPLAFLHFAMLQLQSLIHFISTWCDKPTLPVSQHKMHWQFEEQHAFVFTPLFSHIPKQDPV